LTASITQHPQLKYPLVIEAVFEVRFDSPLPYGIVPGRLYEALKDQFPTPSELPLAKVPIQIGPPHVARHRFTSSDADRLFQTGVGVLTVNHVKYRGFRLFLEDCQKVLTAASTIGLAGRITRMGLRYINKAPLRNGTPWNQIISARVELPSFLEPKVQGRSLTWLTNWGASGSLQVMIAWPTIEEKPPSLVLDLDAFKEPESQVTQSDVVPWLNTVHENLYNTFVSCLTPSYFDSLKGEKNAASA